MESVPAPKRRLSDDDGPATKKLKAPPEEPALYSDAVRKKLAATSRTGQACDRCKERKMKCDTDPTACQPCRQKDLQCFTTDRVSGVAQERGQTVRAENEIHYLREQVATYQRKYGHLQSGDIYNVPALQAKEMPTIHPTLETGRMPSSQYVGWPAPDSVEPLEAGPVNGTKVDILDGVVDVADFKCEMLEDPAIDERDVFNLSRRSILNSMFRRQSVADPQWPPKEEALQTAEHFLVIMSQYIPIVHKASFTNLVHRIYDHPSSVTPAERVQVLVVHAILAHQTAVRDHQRASEKLADSHRFFHHALSFYRELFDDQSLASMQAMALILVHFRNLPKPGFSWSISHRVLIRAIELQYHRDPDHIELPPSENNPLAKELRKRVFHSILGICVTTGSRVGRPAPWQFQHIDLPLPLAIKDDEISEQGIVKNLSGQCDFWPCLQLSKYLPLITELYNNVISVRKPAAEYLRIVDALNTKIVAWRQDWDDCIAAEPKRVNLNVASLLVETWAAEFQLNLFHPSLCTSTSSEVIDRHLEICHKSAKRLLQAFHTLSSRYKGVDFTWHSTVAYALGFGVTLHAYRRRKGPVSLDQLEVMKNEFKGWISLMAYADLVLRTGNHLQRAFRPRVEQLEREYEELMVVPQQHQPMNNNSFAHVNGSNPNAKIKVEVSPRNTSYGVSSSFKELGHPSVHANVVPAVSFVTHEQRPHPPQYPAPYQTQPSPPVPATSYASYAAQFQHMPTSLAPLLNDPTNVYMNYSTPEQTQHEMMMVFSPRHYTEVEDHYAWPMITMPAPYQQHH